MRVPFELGHTPAHKGQLTVTTPIKAYSQVQDVKAKLKYDKRALALFTLGCNTAYIASDMLRLKRDQLTWLDDGRYEIVTVEQKTGKLRRILLNAPTSKILREHIESSSGEVEHPGPNG